MPISFRLRVPRSTLAIVRRSTYICTYEGYRSHCQSATCPGHASNDYLEHNGAAPSLREISEYLGLSSHSSAQDYVEALIRKGALERLPHHRGLRLAHRSRAPAAARSPSSDASPPAARSCPKAMSRRVRGRSGAVPSACRFPAARRRHEHARRGHHRWRPAGRASHAECRGWQHRRRPARRRNHGQAPAAPARSSAAVAGKSGLRTDRSRSATASTASRSKASTSASFGGAEWPK